MATNVLSITKGMDVFACDGNKIGTVGELFSGVAETQDSMGTPYSDVDSGIPGPVSDGSQGATGGGQSTPDVVRAPVSSGTGMYNTGMGTTGFAGGAPGAVGATIEGADAGTAGAVVTPSDTKYFEVKHGGLLGMGGETWYVPFSAVDAVAPGDSVTLSCSADDCAGRYSQRPAPLPDEPPANAG